MTTKLNDDAITTLALFGLTFAKELFPHLATVMERGAERGAFGYIIHPMRLHEVFEEASNNGVKSPESINPREAVAIARGLVEIAKEHNFEVEKTQGEELSWRILWRHDVR